MSTETNTPAPASLAPAAEVVTTPAPADFTPHQKFLEQLPEEYRADPMFKNFNSAEDVYKAYSSAGKMVGLDKNQILRLPNDDKPESWNEIYNKLGRPESADKYSVDKFVEAGIDKEALAEYTQIAHANGVSDKALGALVAKVLEKSTAGMEMSKAQQDEQVLAWQGELKAELGAAYTDKLSLAKNAVKTLGGEALIKEISAKPELFENPAVIKTFIAMGEQLQKIAIQTKEDNGFLPGQSNTTQAMTPNEAKAAIAELQGSDLYKKAIMDSTHPQRQMLLEKQSKLFAFAYPGAQ